MLHLLLTLGAVLALILLGLAAYARHVARRVTEALPPTGRWVEVEGERVHVVERGAGPAIVFVHGLAGQMRNFDYLPLDALAQRHRLVLIDRPGAGHSPRAPGADAGIAAQARVVAGVIGALELERPLLVGHSLGGAIALAVGLNHPERVRGLALIAPLTHFQAEVPAPFRGLVIRSPLLRRLVAWTLAIPAAIATTGPVLRAVFGPEPVPADFAVRGGGLLGLRPSAFCAASEDLVAIERDLPGLQARYGTLAVPVSVLFGRDDGLLDWRAHGEALARAVPHAALEVVGGGHMILVTAPQATARWIERVAAGAALPADGARAVAGG